MSVNVCYMFLDRPELYMFRRMQLSEAAALKQQRNPLQKCMTFHARALNLQDQAKKKCCVCIFLFGVCVVNAKYLSRVSLGYMVCVFLLQASDPSLAYKDAFLRACDEYNSFGSAVSNKKLRVEQALALKLYGLKDQGCHTMSKSSYGYTSGCLTRILRMTGGNFILKSNSDLCFGRLVFRIRYGHPSNGICTFIALRDQACCFCGFQAKLKYSQVHR